MKLDWIKEHKRQLRISMMWLLVFALFGPWMFDSIYVPSEYACRYRLRGDICGVPLSGIRLIFFMLEGIFYYPAGLAKGDYNFSEWVRTSMIAALFLLPLIPFFSTFTTILRGDQKRRQAFTITAWGLAIGLNLYFGITNYPQVFWSLWGLWLYTALAVSALILEILVLKSNTETAGPSIP